jgi:hypothetical protein
MSEFIGYKCDCCHARFDNLLQITVMEQFGTRKLKPLCMECFMRLVGVTHGLTIDLPQAWLRKI